MGKGVEFQVSGSYALFTTPQTKLSGDKSSYMIPTYEAMLGVLSSIYKKPTFVWKIDAIRVMNPIAFENRGVKVPKIDGTADRAHYTYLKDVCYQVKAHIEWDYSHPELLEDRNLGKHYAIAKRAIKRGGRLNVCLGTSECAAYVTECDFEADAEKSVYAGTGTIPLGTFFHNFVYPDQMPDREKMDVKAKLGEQAYARIQYADVVMNDGLLTYRIIPEMIAYAPLAYFKHQTYNPGHDFTYVTEETL